MRTTQSALATVLAGLFALAAVFGMVSALAGGIADAQPQRKPTLKLKPRDAKKPAVQKGHEGHNHAKGEGHGNAAKAEKNANAKDDEHTELSGRLHHSKAAAPIFWFFALLVVAGCIFVITRKNLIAAVMGMVGTFFCIAAVYVMLYAHFIAAIQVLVYAGAIMVLFVFVVMILNRPEDHPWTRQASAGKVVAVLAALYLLFRIGGVMWDVKPTDHAAADVPPPVELLQAYTDTDGELHDKQEAQWGSTKAVGKTLFTSYLFPFEAVSLVLLIAVVGAIAVARPHEDRELGKLGEDTEAGGPA